MLLFSLPFTNIGRFNELRPLSSPLFLRSTSPCFLLPPWNRRGLSSHLISAVRVTSTAVRGVIREGDIKAFESWRSLFAPFRRGASPLLATTPAKTGGFHHSREEEDEEEKEEGSDHAVHHRGREAGGGGPSAVAVEGDDTAGDSGEEGEARGVTGGGIGTEQDQEDEVGPLLPLPFPPMLSPAFSFEAAFEALRIEVAGDDGEGSDIGSIAETGGLGGGGAEEDHWSSPEAAGGLHNSSVDGASDGFGGENIGLCRSSESAGLPAVGNDGDDTQQNRRGGVQRRQRRESLARRQKDAPSAVAELKRVQVEMKTIVPNDDGCAAGDDPDTRKVSLVSFLVAE